MGKTLVEKIFESHLVDNPCEGVHVLNLDRVFCHEITTPPAILDLKRRDKYRVFDPDKIKAVIDHVTPAKDSLTATQGKILRDWAKDMGIKDYFDIGRNGVCHAIFPEKGFVRPGFTVIMGDSHTCTHGAFGAFAAGVGTTDLEVGILKGICAFKSPETTKITITGTPAKGVYAKDVILSVIKMMTTNGVTNRVAEFRGDFVDNLGMDGRLTLCNMAVEMGATSGVCLPDMTTVEYLWPFIAGDYASKEEALADFAKWRSDDDAVYADERTIDISKLVPQVTDEYRPDVVKDITEMEGRELHQIYLGSCTNGRLEDLAIAAGILKGKKVADNVRMIVSPATPKIYSDALEAGYVKIFMDAGACLTNPTCGACLGMSNGVLAEGEAAAATTNRNFNGRMGKGGMVHLCSPATAAASAIEGKLTDPRRYM
ncbi:MAG: 3-isopropylmalate dehydratase large subunit [Spirochaetales bacterium]|nr:3-isopropylmalate dehydratase large subunit [Spirochaetales bacterium]